MCCSDEVCLSKSIRTIGIVDLDLGLPRYSNSLFAGETAAS